MAKTIRPALPLVAALAATLTIAAPAHAALTPDTPVVTAPTVRPAPATATNTCGIGVTKVVQSTVHTVASETTALSQAVARYKAGCDIAFLTATPRYVVFTPTWNGGKWHGYGDMLSITKLTNADVRRIIAKAGGSVTSF